MTGREFGLVIKQKSISWGQIEGSMYGKRLERDLVKATVKHSGENIMI